MGCKHNYWYSQGAFRCKKCGHVTYKSHRGKSKNTGIILISVIVAVGVIGYFVYQTYGTTQTIPDDTKKVFNNTGSTIQRLYSQSQQSFSNLENSVTLTTNADNRVPIAVYDDCLSNIRGDYENEAMRSIGTTCTHLGEYGAKQFKFNIPAELKQTIQGSVLLSVKTKVYQYGANDFKIGLFDQVGEKNYTVSLWQLP